VLLLAPGAGAIATSLSWSPIDDSVLYTGIDSIFIVQPGAPNPGTPLIDKGGSQLWLGLDWLPDGSGFVFSATGGPIGQENSNIYRYLTDFEDEYAGALSVSPNGREVAFEYADDAGDPSQLWIVGIDGANPHPIGIQGESPDWKPLHSRPAVTIALNRSIISLGETMLRLDRDATCGVKSRLFRVTR